jgi:hypothetical protein
MAQARFKLQLDPALACSLKMLCEAVEGQCMQAFREGVSAHDERLKKALAPHMPKDLATLVAQSASHDIISSFISGMRAGLGLADAHRDYAMSRELGHVVRLDRRGTTRPNPTEMDIV